MKFALTGEELREFIHVKDVAKVCASFINLKSKELNKAYIVTGFDKYRISELIKLILEISNRKIKIIYTKNNSDHYKISPYSFNEEISEKIFPKTHIDLGLGIFDLIKDFKKKNKT